MYRTYEDRLVVLRVLGQSSSAVNLNYENFTRNLGSSCLTSSVGILGEYISDFIANQWIVHPWIGTDPTVTESI